MPKKKERSKATHVVEDAPLLAAVPEKPDFDDLLRAPLVKDPLPGDFSRETESAHLHKLWASSAKLQSYAFESFVYAGGSGLVFKVRSKDEPVPLALKIARHKLYDGKVTNPNAAQTISPLSEQELRALKRLSHSHIVRLHDTISDRRGVFAIATTFTNPAPLDQFLRDTLGKHPSRKSGLHAFSPQRLDEACRFLLARLQEVADGIAHMHEQKLFHCDLKPANILIDSSHRAVITDLGSCVSPEDAEKDGRIRVHFTWTYAHPDLKDLISDPHGISGGGLKASAKPKVTDGLDRFDLFALGRTLQESLAQLEREFGERCYASYNFRFLHLIASLLLDGHNTPLTKKVRILDGRRFIRDAALDYPVELLNEKKLTTASELQERLRRFSTSYWPLDSLPELNPWEPDVVNTGVDTVAPFSHRVAEIFRHPAVIRLRFELQLGLIKEVYPGATHTRWSHSLGVFATAAEYYSALLADPEAPAARILLNPEDIEHGLIAAILHDLGQIGFGHDFEAASPQFYDHEKLVKRLLDDDTWGPLTLRKAIQKHWPRVQIERVLAILEYTKTESEDESEDEAEEKPDKAFNLLDPVDGIARDIISGPIDADKLDYLVRDGASCRVPYAMGIDRPRFLRAITVDAKEHLGEPRLALAYRAKGAAAVESVLLARYQMYGAVYWHHSFRCIQAMFTHAVAATFRDATGLELMIRKQQIDAEALREFFYFRVVCGHPLATCRKQLRGRRISSSFFEEPPSDFVGERALEFLWKCSEDPLRELVTKIARRELFRRVFEIQLGALGGETEYSAIRQVFEPKKRLTLSRRLRKAFLDAVYKEIQEKGEVVSVSEDEARSRYMELTEAQSPLIVVDFPMRGIPNDKNFPKGIGDPQRKYISGRSETVPSGRSVFHIVRRLQIANASVRIFAERNLHELIIRYLEPRDVQECVESVISVLKTQK